MCLLQYVKPLLFSNVIKWKSDEEDFWADEE